MAQAAAPTATAAPRPLAGTGKRRPARGGGAAGSRFTGWFFVAPFALVFLVFLIAPLAYAFYLSLYTKGLATGTRFSALGNYKTVFTDHSFWRGVWFVVRFSIVLIPLQMIVSLAAALIIDHLATRFARFARLMIFVPYAIPAVIGALMWGFLYSPTFGPLQNLFSLFHADAPFLLSQHNVFYGLLNVVTWQWAGYYMIIMYAALQAIDPSLYEAATIDGASTWQVALRIKVPLVASSLLVVLVFALIGTLQFFTEPQVLHNISNGSITTDFTPNIYAYNLAFSFSQFNYASAVSFALGAIVFAGVYLFLFLTRKRGGFLS